MTDRRRFRLVPVFLPVLAILAIAGCGDRSAEDGVILATVGDRVVTADYYQQRLARLQENQLPIDANGQPHDMTTVAGKRAFLEVIIDKELMVAKALQLGYQEDTSVKAALERLDDYHAMVFFWQDAIGDPSRFVSEADLEHYYSRLGEIRHCDYIITDTRAEALAAREAALAGLDWQELADRFHYNPGTPLERLRVGVGWGSFRDDFQRPVFAVDKGGITEPVETEYGWWIIRVNDITSDRKPELESIKGEVLAGVAKRKEQQLRDELIAQVRQDRNYHMDEEVLRLVFAGLPPGEQLIDPQTGQPTAQADLRPLTVSSQDYGKVLMRYELSTGPVEVTVADIKTQFDRQNIFDRPKQEEGLGSLRTKLRSTVERTLMSDEAKRRGYFEDQRVKDASFTRIEEMLVERVHREIVSFDQHVSLEELQAFWDEHGEFYHRPERRSGTMVRAATLENAHLARQAALDASQNWSQIVRMYNNDPNLTRTLGKVHQVPSDAEGPVRDTLFRLTVGEISEPVEMPGGWGVIQLDRIHAEERPVLSDMSEIVAQRIRNQRSDRALRQLLDEWREEFAVKVDEDRLPDLPSWEEARRIAEQTQPSAPGL
jgi:parvulin-like peptidyl-prolyl isomerase